MTDEGQARQAVEPDRRQQAQDALDEEERKLDEAISTAKARKGLSAKIVNGGQGVYAIAPYLLAERVARIYSPELSADGGDPSVVAHYLSALAGLVKSIDENVIMKALEFIASVDITLEPKVDPDVREFALRMASRDPHRTIAVADLPKIVSPSVLSLEAAAYLLSVSPEDVSARATALGSAPREKLRILSKRLSDDGALIQMGRGPRFDLIPKDELVAADSRKLGRFAEELQAQVRQPSRTFSVWGHLTITNAETNEFRVVLDRRRIPPELDGRRRAVEGPYSSKAGEAARAGLWDTMVHATLLVEYAGVPGKRPTPTKFTFMEIEPA